MPDTEISRVFDALHPLPVNLGPEMAGPMEWNKSDTAPGPKYSEPGGFHFLPWVIRSRNAATMLRGAHGVPQLASRLLSAVPGASWRCEQR